jgi:hypothetical protein
MNAFARAFRDHMPPNVDMREIDAHICDKEFCNLVLDIVDQWVAEGVIPAGSTDG